MSDPRMLSEKEIAWMSRNQLELPPVVGQKLLPHIAAQQEAIRELWTALDHLLAHTEHKGDAAKLLAVGKSEIVLAKYKPEGK